MSDRVDIFELGIAWEDRAERELVEVWGWQIWRDDRCVRSLREREQLGNARYRPDFMGRHPSGAVAMFDPETTTPAHRNSINRVVNLAKLQYQAQLELLEDMPLLYYFEDGWTTTPSLMLIHGVERVGTTNGSGLPFVLAYRHIVDFRITEVPWAELVAMRRARRG